MDNDKKLMDDYIEEKVHVLKEFGIRVKKSMIKHMQDLWPNEIAIDNYGHSLIMHKLED